MSHRLIAGGGVASVHPLQGLELGSKVRACTTRRGSLFTTVSAAVNKIWQMPIIRGSPEAEREYKGRSSNSLLGGGVQRVLHREQCKLGFEGWI